MGKAFNLFELMAQRFPGTGRLLWKLFDCLRRSFVYPFSSFQKTSGISFFQFWKKRLSDEQDFWQKFLENC